MPARTPAGARKSPLRVAGDPLPVVGPGSSPVAVAPPPARAAHTPREMRQMMISEFRDWLGTQTNKQHRPFQEETIEAYSSAPIALSAWTEEAGLKVDFTGCDTEVLNRFFRAYLSSHTQGGTNTRQWNLHAHVRSLVPSARTGRSVQYRLRCARSRSPDRNLRHGRCPRLVRACGRRARWS